MKTWKIAVAVALVMLTAASAFAKGTAKMSNEAGSKGSWTFGLQGGASMPTGKFGDVASTGFNFGGLANYWMNPQWAFGADVAYHANNASDAVKTALAVSDPGAELKFSTIQYGAHAIYMIPTQGGTMFPYLQGGAGAYNVKTKVTGGTAPGDVSENKFGFNLGGGVDFHATPTVNLGVNGTYHYISADPNALNWFGVEGRVTFRMPTSK
jgi:opacity protein-like surface antigen